MIAAHLFLVWVVIFGAVGASCSCWEEDKLMPVELIFIVGSVCGAVVGMALSEQFKNRGVRITPFVSAVSGWLWLFIELLKSL